ncbi:hypothetical protein ACDY96_30800 [Rhizobium mongolense]|uniref:hypothetical protein n=1 Tax=Rhizobium mongolense TaxID=57676 RepID=UPI0035579B43
MAEREAASSAQAETDEPESPAGELTLPPPPPAGNAEPNDAAANQGDSESSLEREMGLVDTAVEVNACNTLLLAWLFNPAGKKDYYGIPAWGHP